jgi:hypothetical protein
MPVYWLVGATENPIKMIGYVVTLNGKTADVISNGHLYVVEKVKLRRARHPRKPRKSCLICGKLCGEPGARYCSPAHAYQGRREYADNAAFRFIVEFKTANDGASPTDPEIAEAIGTTRPTVVSALRRLEDSGRIRRRTRGMGQRDITIPGGKWIYEEGR